jgi:hypothetical protein
MFSLERRRHDIRWWRREGGPITDISPPYQRRGGQWSVQQKAYLIDSVINGFDLPKFYLADFTYGQAQLASDPRYQYALIDGRQRLEALDEFFSNKLRLDQGFLLLDSPAQKLGGATFSDLVENHPTLADRFDYYQLDFVFVVTDDEARINDMFVRLNSGTGLTGSQVRNAMTGAIPALIRRTAEHPFFVDTVAFNKQRGQDLNVAAKLLLLEFRGALQDTKRRHLDTFAHEAALADELTRASVGNPELERTTERTIDILDRAHRVFKPRDPLLRTQGPVTVYYWLLRSLPETMDASLRDALFEFEQARWENRNQVRRYGELGVEVDRELIAYDSYRRNANDARSIEGMFRILMGRLFPNHYTLTMQQ